MLGVCVRVLLGFQRGQTRRRGIRGGQAGSVTVIQRFGGGPNLNVHFHTLVLDGVFTKGQPGGLRFRPAPPPSDEDVARLRDRVASLRVTFDMYQILTLKELNRGNTLEALAFYGGYTLRPLVKVLRMQYDPTRHNFHTRYVYYNLPADVVWKLELLFPAVNTDDIRAKRAQAEARFYETLDQIRLT